MHIQRKMLQIISTIIHKLTARGFQNLDAVNGIAFYSDIKRKLGRRWLIFKLLMAKPVSTLSREPLRSTCVETYFWRQTENLLCASFCLWALPQVIWVLFCHIIQASRNVFSWQQCLKFKLKNRKRMPLFWRLQCHNSVNSWHIQYMHVSIVIDYKNKKKRRQSLSAPLDLCRPIVGWARPSQAERH